MLKKINHNLIILASYLLPTLALAEEASGLVPCGKGDAGPADCTWSSLVTLFDNVLNLIWNDILIPVAVVAIVWAGIQVLRGKTKPEQLIKSKGALVNVAIGIFLALGAYAIVKTIIDMLASDGSILQKAADIVF